MTERLEHGIFETVEVTPHADGKPWKKACGECLFRQHNPQKLTQAEWEQFYFECDMGLLEFFCIHRTEDGNHRVCACYNALYGDLMKKKQAEALANPLLSQNDF